MRKAIAFLTVFVMSISLFAQTDVAKYGDKGAPEVRIPQTWHSNTTNRTEDFLLVLTDSWGDGWDGAYMDVLVNGTLIYDGITVAASTEEFTLAVDDGEEFLIDAVQEFPNVLPPRPLGEEGRKFTMVIKIYDSEELVKNGASKRPTMITG